MRVPLLCYPHVGAAPPAPPATFTNPVLASGPDPWVIQRGGFYYFRTYALIAGDYFAQCFAVSNRSVWQCLVYPTLRNTARKTIQ